MKTYKITKADLDADNFYRGNSVFDGNVEADENLGTIRFKGSLEAKGYIWFKHGSGIEAGDEIEAGYGIKAGDGIEAGLAIVAKTISSSLRIMAGTCAWKIPTPEETEIRVEKVLSGEIYCGKLVIINPTPKPETITVGNLVFNKVEVEKALKNLKPVSV